MSDRGRGCDYASSQSGRVRDDGNNDIDSDSALCGGCLGPLHNPPIVGGGDEGGAAAAAVARGAERQAVVRCAGSGDSTRRCPCPGFHLACSGLPIWSRLYRNAIVQSYVGLRDGSSGEVSSPSGTALPCADDLLHRRRAGDNGAPGSPGHTRLAAIDDFFCPRCDVEGTSKYLTEYFEGLRTIKASYYSGDEDCFDEKTGEGFVRHLLCRVGAAKAGMRSELRTEHLERVIRSIFKSETDAGLFASAAASPSISEPECVNERSSPAVHSVGKNPAGQESIDADYFGKNSRTPKVPLTVSSTQKCKEIRGIEPTFLVGQPVRLYCHVDNSYHTGRIIDWRRKDVRRLIGKQSDESLCCASNPSECVTPESREDLIDKDIGRTQFLIRFREGVDGRKVAVHQWVFLEEHPLMIGIAIVWANLKAKAIGLNSMHEKQKHQRAPESPEQERKQEGEQEKREERWLRHRPAQVVVRTALEMVSVRELNAEESLLEVNVLSLLFGREFHHTVLRLNRRFDTDGERSEAALPFPSKPEWLQKELRKVQLHDRQLAVSIAMACMELEEERRVRAWHHLPTTHLRPAEGLKREQQEKL